MNKADRLLQDYLKSNKGIDEVLSEGKIEPVILTEEKVEEKTPITKPVDIPQPQVPVIDTEKLKEDIQVSVTENIKKLIEDSSTKLYLTEQFNSLFNESKQLKSDIEMLKEAVVEILNKVLNSDKLFKERLQSTLNSGNKKIVFNRDETGKIISADLKEEKEKDVE